MQRDEVEIRASQWMVAAAPLAAVLPAHFLIDAPLATWAHAEGLSWSWSIQAVTKAGDSSWWLAGSGILFLVWAVARRHNAARWAFAFLTAVAGSGLVTVVAKVMIGKARPSELIQQGFFGFDPFSVGHAVNSFPSGHATTFGAVAMCAALLLPRAQWPILAMGGLAASTRVLVHAHYLSDVSAGYALGMLGALAVFAIWRRRWPDSVPVRGRWA